MPKHAESLPLSTVGLTPRLCKQCFVQVCLTGPEIELSDAHPHRFFIEIDPGAVAPEADRPSDGRKVDPKVGGRGDQVEKEETEHHDAIRGEVQDQLELALLALSLAVAPRKEARFLARLEIKLGGAKDMILCQTENLSASGMLIKTERRYDKGTRIDFEFSLPDDARPIVGVAEVMRHTMVGRDKVGGIGVRFLSFGGDSQRRFEAYQQQL